MKQQLINTVTAPYHFISDIHKEYTVRKRNRDIQIRLSEYLEIASWVAIGAAIGMVFAFALISHFLF